MKLRWKDDILLELCVMYATSDSLYIKMFTKRKSKEGNSYSVCKIRKKTNKTITESDLSYL